MASHNRKFFSVDLSAMAPAADSFEEQFTRIVDGDGTSSANCSCVKLTKQGLANTGKHHSPDDLTHVMRDPMFPIGEDYTLDSSQGQSICAITVSPQEGITSPGRDPWFPLSSFLKALIPSRNDAQSYMTQSCINVIVEGTDAYGSCLVNGEKGISETLKPHHEVVGSIKSESIHMQKVLQRQASLTMGERQASFNADKAVSERCHDAPMNRWRKYKRAASFDSRKIVILFSILSSMGTLILIYLTLRVKQTGDNFNHV